jgi:quinoprotein glucose dehydrogenase
MKKVFIPLLGLAFACSQTSEDHYANWRVKGGTPDGIQYSSLRSITKENVSQLKVAWTYRSGDADTVENRTQIQCNPIIVKDTLFGTTPSLHAFALNAATGKEIWRFNPGTDNPGLGVNRGVTYWQGPGGARILYSFGEHLYALHAGNGQRIETFGTNGRVSLKEGLGARAAKLMVLSNTPGVIFENLLIIGSRVHEGPIAAPGYIRAFDVVTGKLVWTFKTIPHPGETGYDTWPPDAWERVGGANSWAGMSVDHQRGWVFASTGSASFDFYGGNRKGANLFANCVLALDARTGERKWHYQTIHHDLWDRDLPAAPVLTTIKKDRKAVEAVVQITKTGFVFVLDRDSGQPLFPVEETATPPSDLDGEEAWPTQPVPTLPKPFARQEFTANIINTVTGETDSIQKRLTGLRTGQRFIPPSREATVIFPGFDGGAEWGGPAVDPTTNTLYVNANEMPWILTMVDVRMKEETWAGISLYRTHCATCHGLTREGQGTIYPAVRNLQSKYTLAAMNQLLARGKGVMPSFTHLSEGERDAISRYVLDLQQRSEEEKKGIFERSSDIWFSNTGYTRFLTPKGYPAVEPPWGTLTAIDLNTGEHRWQVPLGSFAELKEQGLPDTGSENYGGPVATAGGLIFIAATRDEKIRAFAANTGQVVWEHALPAAGYATPAIYESGGKQFVVIACGGGKIGTKSGDTYVAFALE